MIFGSHIRLRAIEKRDLPDFIRWINDPQVRENLKHYHPISMGQEENWYADVLNRPADTHPLSIEIEQDGDWVLIGNVGFMRINHHDRSAEIGIMIGEKQYWNKGHGTQAMRLMLDHGFKDHNFHRIYLHVYASNPRAIRCYEKAGYQIEGRLRQARYLSGTYQDVVVMGILKHEWQQLVKNGENE